MYTNKIYSEEFEGEKFDIIHQEIKNYFNDYISYFKYIGVFDEKNKYFIGKKYSSNRNGDIKKILGSGTFIIYDNKKILLNGFAEEFYNEKIVYKGDFADGKYHGIGIKYKDDKIIYQGKFNCGYYDGFGRLYDENELVIYEGNFLNGYKHGIGTEYYYYGKKENQFQTIKCSWFKDKYNGLKMTDGVIERLYLNGELLDKPIDELRTKSLEEIISIYAELATEYKNNLDSITDELEEKEDQLKKKEDELKKNEDELKEIYNYHFHY